MNDHPINPELLDAFLDGELAVEEKRRVQEHIRNCSECRRYVETAQRLSSLLKSLPSTSPPPELVEKIKRSAAPVRFRRWRSRVFLAAVSSAAVVVFVFAAILRFPSQANPETLFSPNPLPGAPSPKPRSADKNISPPSSQKKSGISETASFTSSADTLDPGAERMGKSLRKNAPAHGLYPAREPPHPSALSLTEKAPPTPPSSAGTGTASTTRPGRSVGPARPPASAGPAAAETERRRKAFTIMQTLQAGTPEEAAAKASETASAMDREVTAAVRRGNRIFFALSPASPQRTGANNHRAETGKPKAPAPFSPPPQISDGASGLEAKQPSPLPFPPGTEVIEVILSPWGPSPRRHDSGDTSGTEAEDR